jgi:hypothetical protein
MQQDERPSVVASKITRSPASLALWASSIVLASIYLLHLPIYRNYFPFGDDPAVFQASAGSPKLWFTQGFSRYFIVYPEWSTPFTDFMRPGVNLLTHINQILFGQHYSLYFASYYAAQLLVCTLVVLIAQYFGAKSRWLVLISLATSINPAFIGLGLQSAAFSFDVWCGLFAILSLYAILRRRYGIAIISLTLSLFVKEASLYAPIAAAITVFLCTHRKMLSACMLIPLAIWAFAWKFVFIGIPSGIYALPGKNTTAILQMIRGFAIWPTGVFNDHAIRRVLIEHSIVPNLGELLIGAINMMLWVALGIISIRVLRPFFSRASGIVDPELASLFVWLFGALGFGVLVGQQSRFGGSIYPLELILFVAVIHRSTVPILRRSAEAAIALIAIPFLSNTQATLRHRDLNYNPSMQSLVASIRQHQAGVIYILNSPPASSSPSAIANLAGTSNRVVILSQSSGCPMADWPNSTSIRISRTKLEIVSKLPHCAEYEFEGVRFQVLSEGFKGELKRGDLAMYHFPDAKITGRGILDHTQITAVDLGKTLDIEVTTREGEPYSVLYYDWPSGQYRSSE